MEDPSPAEALSLYERIDSAVTAPSEALMTRALAKANGAYGEGVTVDLASAVENLGPGPTGWSRA